MYRIFWQWCCVLFLTYSVHASGECLSENAKGGINSGARLAKQVASKHCAGDIYNKNEIDTKLNDVSAHLVKDVYLKSDIDLKLAELATLNQHKESSDQFWHLVLSAILGGGIVGIVSVLQNKARNFREGLFKCLDGYWTVMKFKADAESDNGDEKHKISSYRNYYRSLFDLQWSEFQLWRRYSLHQETYSEWLKQRRNQYTSDEGLVKSGSSEKLIDYRSVWDNLKTQKYFDENDPFIKHLDLVHEGKITKALKQRRMFDAIRGRI